MGVPQKVRILRFVAEQGIVTVDDIKRGLGLNHSPDSVRVTLYQLGLSRTRFGKLKHGVWSINRQQSADLLKSHFPELPRFFPCNVHLHQVPHALGMNRIRFILENTPHLNVVSWRSEHFLRALPAGKRDGFSYQKIPDAVFWRQRADDSKQKFFLEYERTLKSRSRYKDIFQSYAKRKDVLNKNVLYVCDNEDIRNELMKTEAILMKAGKLDGAGLFQFLTLDKLCKQYSPENTKEE